MERPKTNESHQLKIFPQLKKETKNLVIHKDLKQKPKIPQVCHFFNFHSSLFSGFQVLVCFPQY